MNHGRNEKFIRSKLRFCCGSSSMFLLSLLDCVCVCVFVVVFLLFLTY